MTGPQHCSSSDRIKSIWFLLLLLFGFSCSDQDVQPDQLAAYQQDVIDYFAEIALGFEFGSAPRVTRKWKSEVRIFIGGDKSTEMLSELNRITDELVDLSDQLSFSITDDSLQSNYYIYFGTGAEFALRFPPAQPHVASNWGLFYVYFNGSNEIYSAVMYVDTERTTQSEARKHLLREEFTQSLGLARDSDRYPESMFYAPWTTVTEYAEIDRDLIQLLYHSSMPTGLDESATRTFLKDLVRSLHIGA